MTAADSTFQYKMAVTQNATKLLENLRKLVKEIFITDFFFVQWEVIQFQAPEKKWRER